MVEQVSRDIRLPYRGCLSDRRPMAHLRVLKYVLNEYLAGLAGIVEILFLIKFRTVLALTGLK